jgi:mono/diheme cytochrome c family protein
MTWLMTAQLGSVEETNTFTTTVNQEIGSADGIDPLQYRIYGGDPDQSELIRRISMRGTEDQMPPMGTEMVDPEVQLVRDWIETLSPPN